MAYYQST